MPLICKYLSSKIPQKLIYTVQHAILFYQPVIRANQCLVLESYVVNA